MVTGLFMGEMEKLCSKGIGRIIILSRRRRKKCIIENFKLFLLNNFFIFNYKANYFNIYII